MRVLSDLRRSPESAFTFVELLASSTLIVLLMLLLVSMADGTSKTWRYTTQKIEQFQGARIGFESVTRRLSQATLATYWDTESETSTGGVGGLSVTVPKTYVRRSELRFLSGPMSELAGSEKKYRTHGVFFQAPMGFVEDRISNGGLNNLLNTWGYFVEVGNEGTPVPGPLKDLVKPQWRSRLKELMEPSERLSVYKKGGDANDWFTIPLQAAQRPVRTVAENIVALVLLPQLPPGDTASIAGKVLAPDYLYDSTRSNPDEDINPHNQLPPIVQVVMVAVDELSARRMAEKAPSDVTLGLKLDGLFNDSEKLNSVTAGGNTVPGDLQALESQFVQQKINYRIFNSNVILRGAKWGRENH
jgi:uncharacterized protein (TIGR02599 family)